MSIIKIETICDPPQLFEIYAVVRFTPLRGRRTPGGADRGGSKYRNGLVTPDFYIVVHCNYGSILLRFRDMTRDRQTDRQTSAPFHDMATRSGPHNKFKLQLCRVQGSLLAVVKLQVGLHEACG